MQPEKAGSRLLRTGMDTSVMLVAGAGGQEEERLPEIHEGGEGEARGGGPARDAAVSPETLRPGLCALGACLSQ